MVMKNIFTFNHISTNLSKEEVEKFNLLYKNYHRLYKCYQWKYKRLKRIKLSLELSSIGLTTIGSITGAVTLKPIILGNIAGPGILIQAYLTKSNITNQVEHCKFAYTTYQKILIQIKSFLRGLPCDENIFLSDVKIMNDTIIDSCPSVDKLFESYNKKFID